MNDSALRLKAMLDQLEETDQLLEGAVRGLEQSSRPNAILAAQIAEVRTRLFHRIEVVVKILGAVEDPANDS